MNFTDNNALLVASSNVFLEQNTIVLTASKMGTYTPQIGDRVLLFYGIKDNTSTPDAVDSLFETVFNDVLSQLATLPCQISFKSDNVFIGGETFGTFIFSIQYLG